MVNLSIKSNLDGLEHIMDQLARGQVPFAASIAINRVAEFAKSALQVEMNRVFDRPKPFVLNSIFIKRSNKTNLTATIFHSDKVAPYLDAEVVGGTRKEKPFELIQGNDVLVPTSHTPRDAYGGVSRSYIAKVLSQAVVHSTGEYVLVRPGQKSKLVPGVYQRVGGRIVALFLFKTSATYQTRYDMHGVVDRVVKAEFDRQFAAQMDYALSTARIKL